MIYLDEDLLNEMLDSEEVLSAAGATMEHDGKYLRILCPFHNDKHFGSAIVREYHGRKFVHCFVCDQSFNIPKVVMQLQNITYPEALSYIANMYGGPEMFIDESRSYITQYDKEHYSLSKDYKPNYQRNNQPFPLRHNELNLIGLDFRLKKSTFSTSYSSQKDALHYKRVTIDNPDYDEKDPESDMFIDIYTDEKNVPISINKLYNEDYECYRDLISRKCDEKLNQLENLKHSIESEEQTQTSFNILFSIKKDEKKIKEIKKRFCVA